MAHSTHGTTCHHHAPANYGRAFAVGIALNSAFILVEILYGIRAHSMALIADAGHNISDVAGLAIAWIATIWARKKPTLRHSYGMQSASIIAALANAFFLLLVTGGIIREALLRFDTQPPVAETTVMVVAAIGILINGATALLFMGGKHDLNIRGAFIHMAGDAAISAGVVLSGAMMLSTGWLWLDPAITLIIAAIILFSTWRLLKDSVNLALHAAPSQIDPARVKDFLCNLPGVGEVHDLHIWAMSTSEAALTAHLVMQEGMHPGDDFLHHAAQKLPMISALRTRPCRLNWGVASADSHRRVWYSAT
ncbi:MAG: cation diffusion facilitator family transporter [Alphaproteobacteria bacterium]|nr:cation diffusion facilitator family transporter [Alphaproteobacteria bacterium]